MDKWFIHGMSKFRTVPNATCLFPSATTKHKCAGKRYSNLDKIKSACVTLLTKTTKKCFNKNCVTKYLQKKVLFKHSNQCGHSVKIMATQCLYTSEGKRDTEGWADRRMNKERDEQTDRTGKLECVSKLLGVALEAIGPLSTVVVASQNTHTHTHTHTLSVTHTFPLSHTHTHTTQ